jgi:hypothetical protein
MEIFPCSTAKVHNTTVNLEAVISSALPLDVKIPTLPPSTFPSLIVLSVTDVPSIESKMPLSMSPTNLTFDMTFSPSLNFSVNVTAFPSEFALPSPSPSLSYESLAPTMNLTNEPSYAISYSPSIEVVKVNVTVIFKGVTDYFNKKELTLLSRETWRYLSMFEIHVKRVSILSQSAVNSRRTLTPSLAVVFQIEGHSSPDDFSSQLENLLIDNYSQYKDSLPMLKPFEAGLTTHSPTTVKEQNELISKPNDSLVIWWLVGSAVVLSIIAILSLLFVRRFRSKRQSRLSPAMQTAVAVSVRCI